jgi:hypothetical protein
MMHGTARIHDDLSQYYSTYVPLCSAETTLAIPACKETSLGTPRRAIPLLFTAAVPSLTVQLHEDRADRLGEKRELSSASLKGQQKAAQY